jgi:hypothetical protein
MACEAGAVEPTGRVCRPTSVRPVALALTALALSFALAACSGDDDGRLVSDPAPTVASPTATATPTPTPTPTPDGYPSFEPADYTYDLTIECFCMGTGVPVEVVVQNGEVTGAVYAEDDGGRGGVKAGDPADKLFWLSINDIIDKANDSDAERVDVEWPPGQEYPDHVFIGGREDVADDEIGYSISGVRT